MPLNIAYDHFDTVAQETLVWFKDEAGSVRTGRIKTDLVASLMVEHYGTRTPLQGVASVSLTDARTIVISPWDPTAIAAIEQALTAAQLGIQPVVDGKIIRLSFPMMSEEVREQSVKNLHHKAEEARVRLRRGRDEALSQLQRDKKNGDIPEDDFFVGREELDKRIDAANATINEKVEMIEEDIRHI